MATQFFNRFPALFTENRHLEVAETQPRLLSLDSQQPLSVSSQTRLQYVWQASNTSWDNQFCFLFVCFVLLFLGGKTANHLGSEPGSNSKPQKHFSCVWTLLEPNGSHRWKCLHSFRNPRPTCVFPGPHEWSYHSFQRVSVWWLHFPLRRNGTLNLLPPYSVFFN